MFNVFIFDSLKIADLRISHLSHVFWGSLIPQPREVTPCFCYSEKEHAFELQKSVPKMVEFEG